MLGVGDRGVGGGEIGGLRVRYRGVEGGGIGGLRVGN